MHNRQPDTQRSFKDTQSEFVAFIRDPQNNPIPDDVKQPRMAMYRELLFNNVNSFLSSNFPVLHTLIDEGHWLAIVQDFFSLHPCKTPYFSEIPEEFLAYLQDERQPQVEDPAFMLELAHYEWVEMALSISTDELVASSNDLPENIMDLQLAVSALAWPLAYQFPVHKISPDFQPAEPPKQATFLVVYRDKLDEVLFTEVTPMTYSLLSLIQEQSGITVADCLEQIIQENKGTDAEIIKQGASEILKQLFTKNIVELLV